MNHTRAWTLGGAALLALTIGCTSGGGDNRVGSSGSGGGGGEGGDNGASTGGKRTGGTGGSKSGGTDGTATGGTGGTATGGTGGTVTGGTGGTKTGGTGGTATGGTVGTGGTAAGGTGGTKVSGISWDFEGDVQGWNNGVEHLSPATQQCAHGRLGIGQPMVSTEQKVTGTSSIKYDIDFAAAKAEYTIVCATYGDVVGTPADDPTPDDLLKRTPPNTFAVLAPRNAIQFALAQKGITNGILPIGTLIKGNYYLSRAQGGIQAFLVGNAIAWQSAGTATAGNVWTAFEHILAVPNTIPAFGWVEYGLFFRGLPPDFKGTLYLDSIDIVLP
jgi:hypothetical protein